MRQILAHQTLVAQNHQLQTHQVHVPKHRFEKIKRTSSFIKDFLVFLISIFKCLCVEGFGPDSEGKICVVPLGGDCDDTKPCDIVNQICGDDSKCQCGPKFILDTAADPQTCVPATEIGADCDETADKACTGVNQVCGEDKKVNTRKNLYLNSLTQCACDELSEDNEGVCVIKPTGPGLGETCSETDETLKCVGDGLVCKEEKV